MDYYITSAAIHQEWRVNHQRRSIMEKRILEIINENAGTDTDWTAQTALIDDELIDSFDVVAIISDLADEFDVEITVDDMIPENFNSIEAMENLIRRLQEEQE